MAKSALRNISPTWWKDIKPQAPQKPVGQQMSDLLGGVALAMAPFPVVGDVAGAVSDAAMYAAYPEERTMLNAGMSLAGLLPFVPGAGGVRAAEKAAEGLDMSQAARMQRAAEPDRSQEASIGLRAAQNTINRNRQEALDAAIESVREDGIDFGALIGNPKYWDAEFEEFTDSGAAEYERLIEIEGKKRAKFREVESLEDLNDASHDAQADAFYAIAESRGLNPTEDYSWGGSRYITLEDGTKFRFANHGNTVRDTSMQPSVNVAPDHSTFTDALNALQSKPKSK